MSADAYFSKIPRGCVPLTVRPRGAIRAIQGIPVVVLARDIATIKERTVSSFIHVRLLTSPTAAPVHAESPWVGE